MKRNACKEKVLKPKSNLAFSADLVHLNLITQSNTTLVVFENIRNFRLMLTSKGEVSSLKKVLQYSRGAVGRSLTKITVFN